MERVQLTQAQLNQRAFLGAALMDPAAAREYILRMLPIMFEAGVYQEIFAAVLSLTAAGQPVDVVTVVNAAQAATGQSLDNIKQIVTEMAETCPSISNIGSYAALVVEDYRVRELQADLMPCLMGKEPMDSDRICAKLRRTLVKQETIRGMQADTTAREYDAVLDAALAQLDTPDTSLKLGWRDLDRFGVFNRGRTVVIGGRPGCGKTDFSINLASRLSKKYRVYYLTLEETAEALMLRMLAKVSRIDSGQLTDKRLTPRERQIVDSVAGAMRQHHNMIFDASTDLTVNGVEGKFLQHKPDIAFIDHIGLLTGTDPRQTEYQRISEITRRLKVIAMRMGIVIVELCQISRSGVKDNAGRFCALEDLRGSGTIEQDANAVIFVQNRRSEDSTELRGADAYTDTGVMYAKNREGPTGVVTMRWQPQYHDWQPAPREDDYEDMGEQMPWPK